MTSYPRTDEGREWEDILPVRKWLYQTPEQILIKASNGASDFGNKFGQPLICGSVLTFEHTENNEVYGYDKVIMLVNLNSFLEFNLKTERNRCRERIHPSWILGIGACQTLALDC